MTEATLAALKDAEPVDPGHYFDTIGFKDTGLSYGLIEGELPSETAPLELDEARVVIAEDVRSADEFGRRPVLAVLFEGVDNTDDDVEGADEAHAGIWLSNPRESIGELPNMAAVNPSDVKAIIERAMAKHRLERTITSAADVEGVSHERYLNAAQFLVEAGFRKVEVDDTESEDVFELVRKTESAGDSQGAAELVAA